MRSKNAAKNLLANIFYEIIVFALGIIFPKYIIIIYGSEVNGLITTITRLLSLINLIQAGAVGTAIFQMYKPVADNDFETQSAIIYSSRQYYKRITAIFLILSILLSLFYALFLKNDRLSFFEIACAFMILAVNGALSLRVTSICDIFLSPHQRKYYLTISAIVNQIIHYLFLFFVLVNRLHFLFISIAFLLGGISSVVLNVIFFKRFSEGKISNNPINKKFVIPDRKYLMLSCVGNEAVSASPQVIITTFIGLDYSSVFSVYSLVFLSMKTILNSIQLSVSAIFGNLVKTSDNNHIHFVYDIIELITIGTGAILSSSLGFLIIPFISLYTKGIVDINYLYESLCILVIVYVVLFSFRSAFGYVSTVYGLFKKTCYITLVSGVIGILLAVIFGVFCGMPYVMIGLLCDLLFSSVAVLLVVKRNICWFKIKKLLIRTVVMIALSSLSFLSYKSIGLEINSWLQWVMVGFVVVGISGFSFFLYCLVFERIQVSYIFRYIKQIIKKDGNKDVDSSIKT